MANRQHLSFDDCLEGRRENNKLICSLLCMTVVHIADTCEQFLNLHVGLGLITFLCLFRFSIFHVFLC